MDQTACLLCFSQNWADPVQWSHYADRHRGLCLGFEVPDSLLTPVAYRKHRRVLNEATPNRIRSLSLGTKFKHWEYEQEWRLFEDRRSLTPDDRGYYFKPFSSELSLIEVIVGHASGLEKLELTQLLVGFSPRVRMTKARLSFKHYRVVRQRDRTVW